MAKNLFKTLLTGLLSLSLFACSQPPPPPTETIRSVRTITVSERASGKLRRYSGVVEAASTSSLSFEVPGNVREVLVEVGERISQGQVLARLDTRDFTLNVEAAQANMGQAEVNLADAEREYARLQSFVARDPGFVSRQAMDQARVNVDAAVQQVSYARTRLGMAERDLQRTDLLAPFDGVVTERQVDPFQEVSRGQKLFALHVEGAMEAAVSIPESEIKMVYLGLPGDIQFPALRGESFPGIVTEISSAAGAANAFPIRLTIQGDDPRIRPGRSRKRCGGSEHGTATCGCLSWSWVRRRWGSARTGALILPLSWVAPQRSCMARRSPPWTWMSSTAAPRRTWSA